MTLVELTPEQEQAILATMQARFSNLKAIAESRGYTVSLYQNGVIERDGKAREWCYLNYEPYGEIYATVFLYDLDQLEHVLANQLKPAFRLGQTVAWEADFIAAGRYKQDVQGRVEKVTFDMKNQVFQYGCKTKHQTNSPHARMTSSDELYLDEGELKEPTRPSRW